MQVERHRGSNVESQLKKPCARLGSPPPGYLEKSGVITETAILG
jgi:hypothetical protein